MVSISPTRYQAMDLLFVPGISIPIDLMWDDPRHSARRQAPGLLCSTVWYEGRGWGASEKGDIVDPLFGNAGDADVATVLDEARCERVTLVGSSAFTPAKASVAAMSASVDPRLFKSALS
jgi:hypothetical protein